MKKPEMPCNPENTPTRTKRIQTASAKRRAQQKLELRRTILDAATQLFQTHGYEHFSLRQVAEAIGYSPTTIYLHFKNKDELLYHTAIEGFVKFGDSLKAAYDNAPDPLSRFEAIGRAYVKFGLEFPVHYRLMFMQRGEMLYQETPEGYPSIVDAFGLLELSVEACMKAGVFKLQDVRSLSAMVWAQVHGIVALTISMPEFDEATAFELLSINEQINREGLVVSS